MSRTESYKFKAAQSIKARSAKVLPTLGGSREGIQHLSDDENVRYMCPEDRWNRAFIVKSKDTVLAAIIGPRLADRAFGSKFILFSTLIWFLSTIFEPLLFLQKLSATNMLSPFIVMGCVAPINAILFSNLYLMLEVVKSFECLWLMSLNGGSSILLVFYATSNRVMVAAIGVHAFLSFASVIVSDAWNPAMRSSKIFRFLLWYSVGHVFFLVIQLRFFHVWFLPSADFTDTFELGNSTVLSFNPVMFTARSYFTLLLFFVKFLCSLYLYPGAYIILKSRLYNKKQQAGEVRRKCENIRANYRPSRLHTLRNNNGIV